MGKLNPKQLAFAQNYALSKTAKGNATQAAKEAGYSAKTAHTQGHELLKKLEIQAEIRRLTAQVFKRKQLRAEDVIAELQRLAFSDLSKAFDEDGSLLHPKQMPASIRRCLTGIEIEEIFRGRGTQRSKVGYSKKIKVADKTRALEILAKHFKLLTDVHEVNGGVNPVTVNLNLPANGSEKPVPPPESEPDSDE